MTGRNSIHLCLLQCLVTTQSVCAAPLQLELWFYNSYVLNRTNRTDIYFTLTCWTQGRISLWSAYPVYIYNCNGPMQRCLDCHWLHSHMISEKLIGEKWFRTRRAGIISEYSIRLFQCSMFSHSVVELALVSPEKGTNARTFLFCISGIAWFGLPWSNCEGTSWLVWDILS